MAAIRRPFPKNLRKQLEEDRGTLCEICKKEYDDIHHIDGDHTNNEFYNLQLLCVKCHRERRYEYSWYKEPEDIRHRLWLDDFRSLGKIKINLTLELLPDLAKEIDDFCSRNNVNRESAVVQLLYKGLCNDYNERFR